MSMIKWEPFTGASDAYADRFPSMFGRWPRWAREMKMSDDIEWSPSADISESDREFLIRAELPAVKKDDVHITIDQGMITIEGDRKDTREIKDETFLRTESFQGHFARSFSVPDNVDSQQIRAESKDGVLTIHLPKMASTKKTPIDVKVS
jgi:HSP20 family protein